MGTSVDDGARRSNNWLDQWQSGKLGTGSRVYSFPRAFPSSTDVPLLLLDQPSINTRLAAVSAMRNQSLLLFTINLHNFTFSLAAHGSVE